MAGGLTVQSSTSSKVTSIIFKFGEVMVEYFVYKTVFGFPPFCFYYLFMKLFLQQSKTKNSVKNINQNFNSNNLNKKNPSTLLLKKLICEYLTLSLIPFEVFMES